MAKKKVAKKKVAKKKVTKKNLDVPANEIVNLARACGDIILGDLEEKFGPQLEKVANRLRSIAESMQKSIDAKATKQARNDATAKRLAEQIAKLQAKAGALEASGA